MTRPVLIVLHQEQSTSGRVGHYLEARGIPLDIRRPRYGDPLPETLAAHSGAVIFGGPMSANDPDAFIRTEIEWIKVPLRESKPFLGICLGAQMLARHLGATVTAHREGFDLPAGGELLAEGEMFKAQAFRYGRAAYGIQFHAEVTHAMMCRWIMKGEARLAMPGAKSSDQ